MQESDTQTVPSSNQGKDSGRERFEKNMDIAAQKEGNAYTDISLMIAGLVIQMQQDRDLAPQERVQMATTLDFQVSHFLTTVATKINAGLETKVLLDSGESLPSRVKAIFERNKLSTEQAQALLTMLIHEVLKAFKGVYELEEVKKVVLEQWQSERYKTLRERVPGWSPFQEQ